MKGSRLLLFLILFFVQEMVQVKATEVKWRRGEKRQAVNSRRNVSSRSRPRTMTMTMTLREVQPSVDRGLALQA